MVLRIGHRGACGHAPENTIISIRKALEFKVDAIEFDVRVCKSGEVVLMHDDMLERTTSGKGSVYDHTLAQLQKLDAGGGEKVPTLEEAIAAMARKAVAIIEPKDEESTVPIANLITRLVKEGNHTYRDFMIASFDHIQLNHFREIDPHIVVGASIVGIPVDLAAFAEKCGSWSINVACDHLPPKLVEDAQNRGLRVFAWTVDDPRKIKEMRELGVDGIISNYPDRI